MLIHKCLLLTISLCIGIGASAEPIFYEAHYPSPNATPAPAVLALHSSGGYASVKSKVASFVAAGYVVYTPDFFKKHGITTATRFETWTLYRTSIEQELSEIVQVMQRDPRIDSKNIFAVGYSNGGYWAAYLAAKGIVNAGASHYGVWDFPGNAGGYPANYFSSISNPVLALVGAYNQTQK